MPAPCVQTEREPRRLRGRSCWEATASNRSSRIGDPSRHASIAATWPPTRSCSSRLRKAPPDAEAPAVPD